MKFRLCLSIFLAAVLFTGCQQSEASSEISSVSLQTESATELMETETFISETVPDTELQTEPITETYPAESVQTETETVTESETLPSTEKEYDTFFGVLIDEDCSDFEDPPLHDLPCMLMDSCRASGYGLDIQQEDGSYVFYMFDENGQNLAWDYLIHTDRMDGLYVTVTGILEDNVIKVITLEESR